MIGRSASAAAPLLRHEARRCGPAVWALPAAGVAAGAAVAAFPPEARSSLFPVSGTALAGLVALCVMAMLGGERIWELHLSTPVPVPVLVARRLGIMAVLAAVSGAVAGGTALAPASGTEGVSVVASGGAESAVAVLCTAAPLSGVALWTWARWDSVAAASGTLIAVWLGYALLWAAHVPPAVDRPVCAVAGALLVWRGLRALDDPARVLAKESPR
ncbi:hypothetical protein [Nocardiopsis halotolerans]|uniref:hypothetical protein n=1 Tax=Nocardiopsis halotolerans TaxID=124252 RepID=UPI00034D4D7E|nr:hypothetical protein [Nocardiopsis halotolerans]